MRDPRSPRRVNVSDACEEGDVVMSGMGSLLEPGMLVKHPEKPEWGIGQVQSNIAGKVTVNFREEGKVVINASQVALEMVFSE